MMQGDTGSELDLVDFESELANSRFTGNMMFDI
jgi:hypothetical protein